MFRNEYLMDKALIKEYVYRVLGKKMMIIGTLVFILCIIIFIFDEGDTKYLMLIVGLIGLLCSILSPILMRRTIEKASKRLNNGKLEKTVIEFGKKIKMTEGTAKLEFDYEQIRKIKYTKNFIVLRIEKDAAILVYRNGFKKGKEEDFIKFINEKCM